MSELLCTDVLAILDTDDYIFVGIGYTLRTYKKSTNKLVATLNVCYPDKIHGIVKGSDQFLAVFGGQNLCIVEIFISNETIRTTLFDGIRRFKDWIIAVDWQRHSDNTSLSVLFAHNTFSFYDYANSKARLFQCEEKCILYGGSIVNEDANTVVVLAGTVFQEIVIWTVTATGTQDELPVLHRLRGHNGVIFAVTFDPITSLICSTSDDRTIRLWSVETESHMSARNKWEHVHISLTSTMFGHTARVWRALIRKHYVISIGEDSLICIWTIKGELINKIEAHRGAPIWSLDIDKECDTIVTGGGDGAIFTWSLKGHSDHKTDFISLQNASDVPKHIGFLDTEHLLILTQTGRIICYNTETKLERESTDNEKYRSYAVIQISPNRKYIGLASIDGYISIYEDDAKTARLNRILEEKVIDLQILSMHWLSNTSVLVCGLEGKLRILLLQNGVVTIDTEYILPPSRERWTTAAATAEGLLICGDRSGSIHVFRRNHEEIGVSYNDHKMLSAKHASQSLLKIHGRLGVHSCCVIGDQLLTTGRDGTLRYYRFCDIGGQKSITTLQVDKMPMDWVSRTFKSGGDIYVLGFKEVNFIVYSTSYQRILLRIDCGGGHRSWDYNFKDGILDVAYVRDKRIQLVKCELASLLKPAILDSFHAKEVYCMERIKTRTDQNILVSGGEDRIIRITHIRPATEKNSNNNKEMKVLGLLNGHISSIKSLSLLNLEDTAKCSRNLLFSGGGRAQLKIWSINVVFRDKVTMTSDDVSHKELASHMLRGTDQQQKWTLRYEMQQSHYVDPETRYMDISTHKPTSNLVIILVACSDGFLRIFSYNIESCCINLQTSIRPNNRCILKGHLFTWNDLTIAMTMATDGIVNFWDMHQIIEKITNNIPMGNIESLHVSPFGRLNLHQCGINSYDLKVLGPSEFILATGGDDNLICLSVFMVKSNDGELSLQDIAKWNCSSTHSTQITGLIFHGKNELVSVGIDQKLVVFSFSYESGQLSVSKSSEIIVSIADVQGITACSSDQLQTILVCVYGQGFELLRR